MVYTTIRNHVQRHWWELNQCGKIDFYTKHRRLLNLTFFQRCTFKDAMIHLLYFTLTCHVVATVIFHSIDLYSNQTFQLLKVKNNKNILKEMETLFQKDSFNDFNLQFHTKTKTLTLNHNFPDKWLTLPKASGTTFKLLMMWYLEYHRYGIVQSINWGSKTLPNTPALLHVEIDTQQVTMSIFKNGIAYRYEGYGVRYIAFDTDSRQPFVDFLRFFSKKDKERNMLVINRKNIERSIIQIYKTYNLNQGSENAIVFRMIIWLRKLWGHLTMAGLINRAKEPIIRMICSIIIVKKWTEYLSGVGRYCNEEYRKKVTYSRCVIAAIYAMSPMYVWGSLYPKVLFTHKFLSNVSAVNSYDTTLEFLVTIYCILWTIVVLRKAIPENDENNNNDLQEETNEDVVNITNTSTNNNATPTTGRSNSSSNNNDNNNNNDHQSSVTTSMVNVTADESENIIVVEEKTETTINNSNNNMYGLRNRKNIKNSTTNSNNHTTTDNNNNNNDDNNKITSTSVSLTKHALSPEMKKVQSQMDDMIKKFSSSTAALDNAGNTMREMQSKIEALEKEIAIAKNEKTELQLMHKQGMANVEKQQLILENKILQHRVEMDEQKMLFETRDVLLQRKESEAEVHLQYIEQRGKELQHLIAYARELFDNLNQAERNLQFEEQRLLMKKLNSKEEEEDRLATTTTINNNNNNNNKVNSGITNSKISMSTNNNNNKELDPIPIDNTQQNNINYDDDDELENEQQVQSLKIQLSKLREMANILQASLLAEEDAESANDSNVGHNGTHNLANSNNNNNKNNTESIVNAINSAIQIETTLDSNVLDRVQNMDMNNAEHVKEHLLRLKQMAMNLNAVEDTDNDGTNIIFDNIINNDNNYVGNNDDRNNNVDMETSKNNKEEEKKDVKYTTQLVEEKKKIIKQKEKFPMAMPMGRTFSKNPVERHKSLKEHMNKLKTYAQEKYKWEQIQASKEDVHKE